MKFLNYLVLGLLSLLLFLSLALFSVIFMFKLSLLNPDFVVKQTNKIPISTLAKEMMKGYTIGLLPSEEKIYQGLSRAIPQNQVRAYLDRLNETIGHVLSSEEPQLKEQMSNNIYSFYEFLLGKSEKFSVIISLESLKETMRDSLWQVFKQNWPPQIPISSSMEEKVFNDFYEQFAGQVPAELKLDESQIPQEIMAQIMQVRQYVSYVIQAYYGLIVLTILIISGIIGLNRDIKGATRWLSITFLISGLIEYAGVLAAKYLTPTYLPGSNIPLSLRPWLMALVDDMMSPIQILSFGLMVGGLILIIISIIYSHRVGAKI